MVFPLPPMRRQSRAGVTQTSANFSLFYLCDTNVQHFSAHAFGLFIGHIGSSSSALVVRVFVLSPRGAFGNNFTFIQERETDQSSLFYAATAASRIFLFVVFACKHTSQFVSCSVYASQVDAPQATMQKFLVGKHRQWFPWILLLAPWFGCFFILAKDDWIISTHSWNRERKWRSIWMEYKN